MQVGGMCIAHHNAFRCSRADEKIGVGQCGAIICSCVLMHELVRQVIPLPAIVLVLGGLRITLQRMYHKHLAELLGGRWELEPTTPCSDAIER